MKQKFLCMELTSLEIKVCEVELNTKTNETVLLKNFSVSSNNNIDSTKIYEIDSLVYSIKEKLSEKKISTKKCIVCINSNNIYSRSITVPYQKTSQELLELINARVEYDNIFSAADLQKSITTYSILDKIVHDVETDVDDNIDTSLEDSNIKLKNTKKQAIDYNVMLYNAPESLIADISELVHSCGLKLVSINYAGNSIYQCIKTKHDTGTHLVVYVNDTNSILSVIKDGIMISQKTDEFSYTKVAKKLIDHQDITGCSTIKEALDFINNTRFFEDDYELNHDLLETQQDAFYYMRLEIIDDIVGFFNVIKAYLASMRNTMAIDSIIYISNNETFPDLTESIEANVNIEVKTYNKKDLGYSSALLICINSCISPINFNIEESNKIVENRRIGQYTIVGVIFTLWVCIIYIAYNLFSLSSLKAENKKLEKDILAANEAQIIFNKYRQSKNAKDNLDKFKSSSVTVLNDLDKIIKEIEDAVPVNRLHIEGLNCTTDSIVISIKADSKDSVAYFIEELEKISYFEYIDTSGVTETSYEDGDGIFASSRVVTSSITCSFTPKEVENNSSPATNVQEGDSSQSSNDVENQENNSSPATNVQEGDSSQSSNDVENQENNSTQSSEIQGNDNTKN